eukprot:scaffold135787_cov99-Phaeocystis_antarctica.AAC.1
MRTTISAWASRSCSAPSGTCWGTRSSTGAASREIQHALIAPHPLNPSTCSPSAPQPSSCVCC